MLWFLWANYFITNVFVEPFFPVARIIGRQKMDESIKTVIALIALVLVYLLSRKVHAWRMMRAYHRILRDLDGKGAVDEATAVDLPYAKMRIFRVGMRDYRPKAMAFLVSNQMVGMTGSGKYYLKERKAMDLSSLRGQGEGE